MFFFFKQKTAYELRISDWSSDVCSSDLPLDHLDIDYDFLGSFKGGQFKHGIKKNIFQNGAQAARAGLADDGLLGDRPQSLVREGPLDIFHLEQIGRAHV